MKNTKIEWTHHTFNPWRGCSKVSEGCRNCYAASFAERNPAVLGEWGPHGTRVIASEAKWREPPAWSREAAVAGEMQRVFCASLADVFEGQDTTPEDAWPHVEIARRRLFNMIRNETPFLHWLLLTKRPQNIVPTLLRCSGWYDVFARRNLWLGTSVEDQATAEERIPHLLRVRHAGVRVRFLSCEPLLGPVDLGPFLDVKGSQLHWVIVGGESGGGSRPFRLEWCEEIVSTCRAAGVPVFVKQMGRLPVAEGLSLRLLDQEGKPDRKGGNIEAWPDMLKVRQLPRGV